mgnify:FL=1
MILTIHYVHSFLIACNLVLLGLIVYFNYQAIKIKLSNKIIQTPAQKPTCNYDNLPIIKDTQKCTKNGNSGNYYIEVGQEPDAIYYLLDTVQTSFLNVCKTLCDSYTDTSGECKASDSNLKLFNDCKKSLQPGANCSGLVRPLGKRYDTTTKEEVYLYPKSIIQKNNCI